MSERSDKQELRTTFEEVAGLYDRARPLYPSAVLDDLIALTGLSNGARIIEIGCGTGQATLPLAERGLEIVAVELGGQLTAFARRKLARFINVEIVNASFEEWEPERAGFDAVVAFTAFHWVDPGVRYRKSARLLREGGSLAVVMTHTVLPEDGDPFWAEVEEDYDAVVPSDENRPPPHPDEVDDLTAEIEGSGCFGNVGVRRHLWEVKYTADEYIAWLDTTSGHRSIEQEARQALYERIRRRIEARPDGQVRRTYLAVLNVARRLSDPDE